MNLETEQIYLLNPPEVQPAGVQQKLEVPVAPPVNLEDVCDFSSVCRVCAAVTEFVIPIFSGEGLQNNLADKIHKHLPIQVSEQDGLPQCVCYQCCCTLLAWHELVACARQAERALRLRLGTGSGAGTSAVTEGPPLQGPEGQQPEAAPPPPPPETEPPNQSLETNKKDKELAMLEFELPPPPVYPSPPPPRSCQYCPQLLTQEYKEHLIDAHSDLLFHCDECDTYVARKDFILHMSVHVASMCVDKPEEPPEENLQNSSKKEEEPKEIDQTENDQQPDKATTKPKTKDGPDDGAPGDFSDHSDMDDGFGPLPESVFKAIEDSQDIQPVTSQNSTDTSKSTNTSSTSVYEPSPEKQVQKKKKHKISRTCPICGKVYSASSSYFYHMKYFHKNIRDQECDTCGRKFGTKASLSQHKLLHSREKRYECKECHKKLRTRASLYIHEQTHNGVKNYACSQCQMSFRWRTHLKRHLKRHVAEKMHICSTCGRGFSIRCDLLRHARTHVAGNHECDKCGVKFAQIRYLKVHMDKKHSVVNGAKGNDVSVPEPETTEA